jgi:hypothetical protein
MRPVLSALLRLLALPWLTIAQLVDEADDLWDPLDPLLADEHRSDRA